MNVTIKNEILHENRNGQLKAKQCPFTSQASAYCTTNCALFELDENVKPGSDYVRLRCAGINGTQYMVVPEKKNGNVTIKTETPSVV